MRTLKKFIIFSIVFMFSCLNAQAYMYQTPSYTLNYMYRLAAQGRVDELINFVDKGADIDVVNSNDDTGLCIAVQRENVVAYDSFVTAGANPHHSCTKKLKNYGSFLKKVKMYNPSIEISANTSWKKTGYILGTAALIGGGVALGSGGGGGGSSGSSNSGDEDIDDEKQEEYCKNFSGKVTCESNQVCSQYTCGVCSACMTVNNPCEENACSQGCYKNVDCSQEGFVCGATNECGGCEYCINENTGESQNLCEENACNQGCYKNVVCEEGYTCFATNKCGGCESCVEKGNASPSNFVISADDGITNSDALNNTGDDKQGTWGGIYVPNKLVDNVGDIILNSEKIGNAVGILSCAVGNVSSCFANYEALQGENIFNGGNISITAPKENVGILSSSAERLTNAGEINITGNDSTGIALVGYGNIINQGNITVEGKVIRQSDYLMPFVTNNYGTVYNNLPYQNSNIFFSNYFLPFEAGNGVNEKYAASNVENYGNLTLALETDKKLVNENDKAVEAASMTVVFDPHISESPLSVNNNGSITASLQINAKDYIWDKYGLAGIFVLSPQNREFPNLSNSGFKDIQFTADTAEILEKANMKVFNNGSINVSSDGKAYGILAPYAYVESRGDIEVISSAEEDYSAYGIAADYVDLYGRVNVSKIGDVAITSPVINFREGSSIGQGRVIANVARNYSNLNLPLVEVYDFYNHGFLRIENDYVSTLGSSYMSFVDNMHNYNLISHAHIYKGSSFTNYVEANVNEALILGDDTLNTFFNEVVNEGNISVGTFDINTTNFTNGPSGNLTVYASDKFEVDLNEEKVSSFVNHGTIVSEKSTGEAKGLVITSKEAEINNNGMIDINFTSDIASYDNASYYEGISLSSKEDYSTSLPTEESLKTIFNNNMHVFVNTTNADADLYGISISNALMNNYGEVNVRGGINNYLFNATNSVINQHVSASDSSIMLDNSVFNNMQDAVIQSVDFYAKGNNTSVVNNYGYMEYSKFYNNNIALNNKLGAFITFSEGAEVYNEETPDAYLKEFINEGYVSFTDTAGNNFFIKTDKFTNKDTGLISNLGYLTAKEFVNEEMAEISDFNYLYANSFINNGNIYNSLFNDETASSYGIGQIVVQNGYFENTGTIMQTSCSDNFEHNIYGIHINDSEIYSTGNVVTLPMYIIGQSHGLVENVGNLIVYETSEQGIEANNNYYVYASGYVDDTGENDRFVLVKGSLNDYVIAEGTKTTVINDGEVEEIGMAYLMIAQNGGTIINQGTMKPNVSIAMFAQNGGVAKNSGEIINYGQEELNTQKPITFFAGLSDAEIINESTGVVSTQNFALQAGMVYLYGPNVSGKNDGKIISVMTNDDYTQNTGVYALETSEEGFVNNGTITIEGGFGGNGMAAIGYVDGTTENDRYIKLINSETGVINIGSSFGYGMYATGANSIIINNGTINVSGEEATAMDGIGGATVVNNNATPTAMFVSHGATFVNNGIITSTGELDLNIMQTPDASIVAGLGSNITALSLSGNLLASSDVVKGANNDNYVNKNVITAEDKGIKLASQSAMFDANLQNGTDIVYERKGFETLLGNNNISQYLENNYVKGNGVEVFDIFKNASNLTTLNNLVNSALGTDFLPVLAYQDLNRSRRLNANLEDLILEESNKDERILVNSDNWYEEHKNHKGIKGYEDKLFGFNALFDVKKGEYLRQGLGFGVHKADSEYNGGNERDDNMFMLYLSSMYETENYGLMFMPYAGYSEGEYERNDGSKHYEADLQNYYLGINTKAWLNKNVAGLNLKPTLALNVEHIAQDNISEDSGINANTKDITSIEAGLGLSVDKSLTFNDNSHLSLKSGVMYYYELNDKVFDDIDAKLSSLNQNSYLIKGYDSGRSRGVINLKADYNIKNFNVYGQILKLIENDDNMVYNIGLKIGF